MMKYYIFLTYNNLITFFSSQIYNYCFILLLIKMLGSKGILTS